MNHQTEGEQTLVIAPGIYRIIEVAEAFKVSRSTINRYISKFKIQLADLEYQGKIVKGIVLDHVLIMSIDHAVKQGVNQQLTSMDDQWLTDEQDEQPVVNQALEIMASKLEAANQRFIDLEAHYKALLIERNRIIESKDSEISTLKTAMVMVERLNQYEILNITAPKANPFGRLGEWLSSLRKTNNNTKPFQQNKL
jgi:hypothetical protein